jgi:hypothetical protein
VPARADILARRNLAAIHAGLMAIVTTLFGRYLNLSPGQLTFIALAIGAFTVDGQARSIALAQGYLSDLSGGTPAEFSIPDGLATLSASGNPIMAVAAMAVSLYWRRRELGDTHDSAMLRSRAVLANLASSEPYRAFNAVVVHNAARSGRFSGRVVRVTRPGACPFCQQIAQRGYWPLGSDPGFAAHAYCQCTASPETRTI